MFGSRPPHTGRHHNRTTGRSPLAVEPLEDRTTPTVIATPDNYTVAAGQTKVFAGVVGSSAGTLGTSSGPGVLANDYSTTNFNALLSATQPDSGPMSNPPGGALAPALPPNTIRLQSNGTLTVTIPAGYDPTVLGPITFTYRAIDENGTANDVSQPALVTITVTGPPQTTKLFATGAGPGAGPQVNVYTSSTGNTLYSFFPYEQSFTGGVRVATGDLNGDGVDDIAVVPASGGSARVQVYDGKFGIQIADFFVFEPTFRGGAEIAIGNVDGSTDGKKELIVGAGDGGAPRVVVYTFNVQTPQNSSQLPGQLLPVAFSDFFAYEPTFRNGVRVAAGNVSGITGADARDFIVTGAGAGGGPSVKVFDGRKTIGISTPPPERSFFAFDSINRGGVSVAVGQFSGSGAADIVVGSGTNPEFKIFDGRTSAVLRDFVVPTTDGSINTGTGGTGGTGSSTGSTNFGSSGGGLVTTLGTSSTGTGGIRVATTDRNGDGLSDVIVGAATGTVPRVRIFDGNSFAEISNFLAYPSNFLGGVFVGGNSL